MCPGSAEDLSPQPGDIVTAQRAVTVLEVEERMCMTLAEQLGLDRSDSRVVRIAHVLWEEEILPIFRKNVPYGRSLNPRTVVAYTVDYPHVVPERILTPA